MRIKSFKDSETLLELEKISMFYNNRQILNNLNLKINRPPTNQRYNAIESLDINQLEAAKDLGSSPIRTHLRIVIPHAKAGIASGCTMVFMLTAGALATPVVLSSPNTFWFTQLIFIFINICISIIIRTTYTNA